jgi:hypothetical protein
MHAYIYMYTHTHTRTDLESRFCVAWDVSRSNLNYLYPYIHTYIYAYTYAYKHTFRPGIKILRRMGRLPLKPKSGKRATAEGLRFAKLCYESLESAYGLS